MTDALRHNANLVESLGSAMRSGEHGLSAVPGLLQHVLEEGSWREFITQRGEHVQHQDFERFLTTPPLKGLGVDEPLVRRVVQDHPVVLDLLDRALQRPTGTHALYDIQTKAPAGTARAAGLRRLRKDRPDLHEEVLAGRLTAHRAMVNAGFRKRTATVPVDDPVAAARTIRRQFGRDALIALIAALLDNDQEATG